MKNMFCSKTCSVHFCERKHIKIIIKFQQNWYREKDYFLFNMSEASFLFHYPICFCIFLPPVLSPTTIWQFLPPTLATLTHAMLGYVIPQDRLQTFICVCVQQLIPATTVTYGVGKNVNRCLDCRYMMCLCRLKTCYLVSTCFVLVVNFVVWSKFLLWLLLL